MPQKEWKVVDEYAIFANSISHQQLYQCITYFVGVFTYVAAVYNYLKITGCFSSLAERRSNEKECPSKSVASFTRFPQTAPMLRSISREGNDRTQKVVRIVYRILLILLRIQDPFYGPLRTIFYSTSVVNIKKLFYLFFIYFIGY